MKILFLDAPYKGKVELCKETLNFLKDKDAKSVALLASVQFCNNLANIKQQLKELNLKVISPNPKRTDKPNQLLGCDVYHDSLNLKEKFDHILYVGDGRFHPLALIYEHKEVLCNDPIENKLTILTSQDIERALRKQKAYLKKFLMADTMGIINTIKPGQEQMHLGLKLEEKYPKKKFYHFIDDVVSFDQLENFPFIELWVNTACPRIGLDDQDKFNKGVINIIDALNAEEILTR